MKVGWKLRGRKKKKKKKVRKVIESMVFSLFLAKAKKILAFFLKTYCGP
jgi:hypothetical protein